MHPQIGSFQNLYLQVPIIFKVTLMYGSFIANRKIYYKKDNDV
jgi:hypothetical protein